MEQRVRGGDEQTMNATEERSILDAIQDATHEQTINNNEHNRGILHGLDIVASLFDIDPNDVIEAVQAGQNSVGGE